jgi:hypothetical protein
LAFLLALIFSIIGLVGHRLGHRQRIAIPWLAIA